MRNLVLAKIHELWDECNTDDLGFIKEKLIHLSNKELLNLLEEMLSYATE